MACNKSQDPDSGCQRCGGDDIIHLKVLCNSKYIGKKILSQGPDHFFQRIQVRFECFFS